MPTPRLFLAVLSLGVLGVTPVSAGDYARKAAMLADIAGTSRPQTIAAPNGLVRAVARFWESRSSSGENRLIVYVGAREYHFAGGGKAELLWAPDSRSLAVTSNGGDVGSDYLATILTRTRMHGWKRIDLTKPIARLFGHPVRCAGSETPNVAILGWTSAARLIAVAQVPPHARCKAAGTFEAYVVDVPSGEILMAMDQRTAKRRYRAMMGPALRHASDRRAPRLRSRHAR